LDVSQSFKKITKNFTKGEVAMKTTDIEKKLKQASYNFAPDIMPAIVSISTTVKPTSLPKTRSKSFVWLWRFAYLSAAVIMVFGMFLTLAITQEYDKVYLELNPSVEFTINRFDRVIDVNYINTDAELLFDNTSTKGKKITEVLEIFVIKAKQQGYFNSENIEMYLTLASTKNNYEERLNDLKSKLNQHLQNNNVAVDLITNRITREEENIISNENVTPAKHAIIVNILALNNNYTFEQLSALSFADLRLLLKQLQNNR
jgi:hypothetical protein